MYVAKDATAVTAVMLAHSETEFGVAGDVVAMRREVVGLRVQAMRIVSSNLFHLSRFTARLTFQKSRCTAFPMAFLGIPSASISLGATLLDTDGRRLPLGVEGAEDSALPIIPDSLLPMSETILAF